MTPPPGIILAGGQSRRMGADKALLPLAGQPMILRTIARLAPQTTALAIAGPQLLGDLADLPVADDGEAAGYGPLAGILAGMRLAGRLWPQATHLVSAPVDCPFLPHDIVARLTPHAGPLPVVARSMGRLHPVAALWPIALRDTLEATLLGEEKRGVIAFLETVGYRTQDFAPLASHNGSIDPFFNMNTRQDLEIAEAMLGETAMRDGHQAGFSPPRT